MKMKRPEATDFEVMGFDAGADVIFKPTFSYYGFSLIGQALHGHGEFCRKAV